MRKLFIPTMVFATVLLGVSVGTARAEDVERATVPFSFVVNGRTLPAGQYMVRVDDDNPAVVRLDSTTNRNAHAMVLTNPEYREGRSGGPKLTFIREGKTLQLQTVWESGDYGREVVVR
jgi:hypothetical protein